MEGRRNVFSAVIAAATTATSRVTTFGLGAIGIGLTGARAGILCSHTSIRLVVAKDLVSARFGLTREGGAA